jgi:putative SOS response-associated peptidase YedK
MCFHTATPKKEDLAKMMPADVSVQDYMPYYHTSGFEHKQLPVMTADEPHLIQPIEWGLIPFFAKDARDAAQYQNKTLNARSERVFTTPMFRNSARRRCLIFVSGFFEWKHVGKEKIPHFIYMPDHRPFALGGIYNAWHDHQQGQPRITCSIVTTSANELMADIHNSAKRMPFVAAEYLWSAWLDPDAPQEYIQSLMAPYHDGELQAHQISKLITSRSQDSNVPDVQARIA